jgi:hypothetical protein
MTTDRELLELAAKAAGIEIRWHDGWRLYTDTLFRAWAPLLDYEAAMNLAVVLNMDVMQVKSSHEVWAVAPNMPPVIEPHGEDPNRATRRAIVRAAAEIGKAMP